MAKDDEQNALAQRAQDMLAVPAQLAQTMAELDTVVSTALERVNSPAGRFVKAVQLSVAVQALRDLLPINMVERHIMPLQNTPLGFRTDKDNGYPPQVVRECLIEAVLRGVYPVGNEFNIISAQSYVTKQGLRRLVLEYPGLANLEVTPGVPQMANGGALVPMVATWTLNGEPQRLERTQYKLADGTVVDARIPVRVNQGMGAAAILGKATRKLYAAIYDRLTGQSLPDGEADEIVVEGVTSQPAQPTKGVAGVVSKLKGQAHEKPSEPAAPAADPPADPQPVVEAAPAASGSDGDLFPQGKQTRGARRGAFA